MTSIFKDDVGLKDVTISEVDSGTIDDLIDGTRKEAEKELPFTDAKPPPEKKKPAARPRGKPSLKQPLTDIYGTLGAGVFILNQADGIAILSNAEKMAESLDNWGKVNPAVYKVLERLCSTGALGAVIAAHAPVVMAILNNHDVIPTILGKNGDKNETSEGPGYQAGATVNPENPGDYVAATGKITPLVVEPR